MMQTRILTVNSKILKTLVTGLLFALLSFQMNAQLAAGKCKFLGNVIGFSVPSSYNDYWNQVTPENAGKWGSVEFRRDRMRWDMLDRAYHHAKDHGLPFRHHTLIWGQQQPGWIDSLPQNEQRAEVEEWIRLFGERYPQTDFMDVVNEPLHEYPSYADALGGSGDSGWDWVIWCFKKARQYCPDAKLHLNEYRILNSTETTDQYLTIIDTLQSRGLIDGIGLQGHFIEDADTAVMRSNLDRLAETGLPIYVTEYDVNIADDTLQYLKYREQFPVIWEHPGVAGVTLWGYIQGRIWRKDSYLIMKDGSKRQSMKWLSEYVKNTTVQCPDN
jgi:endo-1,4-beta-xylanase